MDNLGRKIIVALAILLAIALSTRLAWALLRPAVPFLIGVFVILIVISVFWRKRRGW